MLSNRIYEYIVILPQSSLTHAGTRNQLIIQFPQEFGQTLQRHRRHLAQATTRKSVGASPKFQEFKRLAEEFHAEMHLTPMGFGQHPYPLVNCPTTIENQHV